MQVWEAVGGYTPEVVAQRLLSQTGAHLALLLMIMVGLLVLKLTLMTWIEVSCSTGTRMHMHKVTKACLGYARLCHLHSVDAHCEHTLSPTHVVISGRYQTISIHMPAIPLGLARCPLLAIK